MKYDRARLLSVIAANEEFMGRTTSDDDLRDCIVYNKLIQAVVDAMDGGDVKRAGEELESWQKVYTSKASNDLSRPCEKDLAQPQ